MECFPIQDLLDPVLAWVSSLGLFAPLIFILLYVVGVAIFIPTVVLTLMAGALFQVPMGFAVVLTASLTGASIGFLSGRYFSRGWVLKKVASDPKFEALDHAVGQKGWKLVLLLRCSAICPFMVLNYGLGLSKISFKQYFLASLAGMIPGVLLYVYLGAVAGKLILEKSPMQQTPIEWLFVAISFASMIAMAAYSTKIVRKALHPPDPVLSPLKGTS